MGDADAEVRFTVAARDAMEADLSCGDARTDRRPGWPGGVPLPPGSAVVWDAEGVTVAACPDLDTAEVVCRLLNWALENYPFRRPA